MIQDVTFHDLPHEFAHRARAARWTIEEVAYYLGHMTKKGTPAIQTTARHTRVSRERRGKPQPGFWDKGCGQAAWLLAVSGMERPVPSTTLTGRPTMRQLMPPLST